MARARTEAAEQRNTGGVENSKMVKIMAGNFIDPGLVTRRGCRPWNNWNPSRVTLTDSGSAVMCSQSGMSEGS
jgi:hypothetical protein